ncbi:phage tail tape measure protein [Beduini massiliensis]|uniref:phage tail tape measure protein n=1 Tax=Beduini massiliensis TaxID=1585974 RepID=UPI000693AE7F|nr:phage tail tape measure protein [Beduini massiliensis]
MAEGIKLAPLYTQLKVDIKNFKTEMDQVKTEAMAKAKAVSKEMEKTVKVGENMSKLGGTLTKTVSLPLVGIGTAATKMAVDFESSFAKVSTLLDANVVDYGKYKNDLLDASSDSKVAVEEFSEAVYGSISAGVDQTKAIQFTTDAMKLAKGGFTDGAKAVDVMTTAINGYGMKAEDATKISDMLITTQNLGKTTVDELASSMGAVIPVANSVNFGIDELSASYAQLTKNGIATAESGTYLKAMLSELGKSGSVADKALRELTGKGFADLKKEGQSTSDILKLLSDHAEKNGKTLKDMFGSVEAGSAALVLAKGNGAEYNEMLGAMQTSAGATQEAFEKMDATPAERMKGALNELKNSGIKLGQSLIPIVEKVADVIGDVAGWLSKLTPEQQQSILKWGAMAIAIGPVLKVTGGLVSTYGKLKPLLSGAGTMISKGIPLIRKLGTSLGNVGLKMMDCGGITAKLGTALAGAATSSGGFIASLGTLASASLPWVAGAAAIGTAAYGIYKVLNTEVIPEVDLFKDKVITTYNDVGDITGQTVVKISEATQAAVQAYVDMDDQVSQSMYEMKVNNTKITGEIANDMISKFNNMGDSIVAKQNETTQTSLNTLQQFFSDNIGMTDEHESIILTNITAKHEEQVAIVDNCKARIQAIYQNAADQNRSITEQEQQEINDIQSQMRDNAITTFSETEAEAAVIRERMKDYQGRLSADMASDMIKKANEARDGEINAANEKYDGVVKEASRLKQAGLITEEEYQAMVDSAEETRKQQIQKAEEACEGIKTEIQEATPGIEEKVNMQTGKVKTAWDQLSSWAGGVFDWLTQRSDMIANKINGVSGSWSGGPRLSHYNGLDYVPYDGYNARLHEGERVLTKEENQAYSKGNADSKRITIEVPVVVNGRKIAIATKEFNQEELCF